MRQLVEIRSNQIHGAYTISQAKPEDGEGVQALLLDVAGWLHSRGSSQWNGLLEGKDSHDTAGAIRRGNVFVCRQDSEVSAMVMLLHEPSNWDRRVWGTAAHLDDQALYLHRLAVRRRHAGTGLGQALLNWCDSGIRVSGKRVVRLDCIADNPILNGFYSRNGFACQGEKDGFCIYEKPLSLNQP